jgi:hypothetical protein
VTEIYHVELRVYVLRAVQVRLKSVNNEGHFTLQVETAFRPDIPSLCSGVTEI